jgi:hypothetical protein
MSAQAEYPDFDRLLDNLIETHRKRQDLQRAELRLGNHIEAVYRRFTGLKQLERARLKKKASTGLDQSPPDNHTGTVQPDDDTASGGDQLLGDTQFLAVPAADADLTPQQRLAARCKADPAFFADCLARAERWCVELDEGRKLYATARKPYEKRLEKLARELPVWQWAEGVRGLGALSLAQIVAECGDLSKYDNPARVWKRMGLAVIGGERQRKVTDPEQAKEHGYNPQRRSIMFVVGDNLVKLNQGGPYRTYYLAEKARQAELHPDLKPIVIDRRAKRHMTKRLLKHLWQVWRGRPVSDIHPMSGPDDPAGEEMPEAAD